MNRQIILTADGSHTMQHTAQGITYHSTHGALQESRHVFIEAGLQYALQHLPANPLNILEVGLGTGLNALLSLAEARINGWELIYLGLEPDPLDPGEAAALNYGALLPGLQSEFEQLHQGSWEQPVALDPFFCLHKTTTPLQQLHTSKRFHLVYFDAFAPVHQPGLWEQPVWEQLYGLMLPGALLVTYCSKSVVRRAMQAAGLRVTKIPGPYGKRDMVRAFRPA
jgi:tRNA U34 5-methylaminomethyl-2-thiouridine-forming methyltransferase MnmC